MQIDGNGPYGNHEYPWEKRQEGFRRHAVVPSCKKYVTISYNISNLHLQCSILNVEIDMLTCVYKFFGRTDYHQILCK